MAATQRIASCAFPDYTSNIKAATDVNINIEYEKYVNILRAVVYISN